jgi:putative membrane protein
MTAFQIYSHWHELKPLLASDESAGSETNSETLSSSGSSESEVPEPSGETVAESRVREHLSNQRTYLSWMRTSIALMGLGVLISRFSSFLPPDDPAASNSWLIGIIFPCIGLSAIFLATQHYFAVRRAIDADTYDPSRSRWVVLLTLIVLLIGAGIIYLFFILPIAELPKLDQNLMPEPLF